MKLFVFLFLILFILSGCPGKITHEGCDFPYYEFTMPVSFVPEDSIIKIGDTITVTSQISRLMMDDKSHYTFDFDSIDFYNGLVFVKLDTTQEAAPFLQTTKEFNFLYDVKNDFVFGNNVINFDYIYNGSKYYIQFKIIPKKKGVYLFEFNSLYSYSSLGRNKKVIYTVDQKCNTENWYPYFKTNNGNNYKEILKLSPRNDYNNIYYSLWPRYNKEFGAHCFIVQ